MRRIAIVVTGTALVLAAGCSSGGGGQTGPTPAPSAPPTSAPAPVETPTPPACPDGTYRLASFEPRDTQSPIGAGQGGGVRFIFTDGTFTIGSDGSDPIRAKAGPAKAELTVDGEIRGTYSGTPDALRLVAEGTTGELRLKGLGINRTIPMQQVADQIIPSGTVVKATCDPDGGARLDLPRVDLVLARN